MRKILTAIGNSNLNNKIRELENYEVLAEDITNDDKLLEFLEDEEVVDVLFLCKNIISNYDVPEFIDLIRRIHKNVFIVLFKEEGNEDEVKSGDKLQVCDEVSVELCSLEKLFDTESNIDTKRISKIIAVSGANGIGKSIFSTFFAKNVEKSGKKVLLVDFDLDENHIKTILKLENPLKNIKDVKNMIIKVHENLDVLCNLKLFFPCSDNINFFVIQKMIIDFTNKYDLIIIDTSSNINIDYTKKIFHNSDKIIFLVEPNILGLKKAKDMLEIIEIDWKIATKKINIILNKTNMYEISKSIVQELFSDIEIIGKIKYNEAYNLVINKDVDKKEINEEYEKILKNIGYDS